MTKCAPLYVVGYCSNIPTLRSRLRYHQPGILRFNIFLLKSCGLGEDQTHDPRGERQILYPLRHERFFQLNFKCFSIQIVLSGAQGKNSSAKWLHLTVFYVLFHSVDPKKYWSNGQQGKKSYLVQLKKRGALFSSQMILCSQLLLSIFMGKSFLNDENASFNLRSRNLYLLLSITKIFISFFQASLRSNHNNFCNLTIEGLPSYSKAKPVEFLNIDWMHHILS